MEVSRDTIPKQLLGRPQPLNGVVGDVLRSAEDIADWAEGPAVGIEDPQIYAEPISVYQQVKGGAVGIVVQGPGAGC